MDEELRERIGEKERDRKRIRNRNGNQSGID